MRLNKIIEYRYRLMCVKMSFINHKYGMFSKTLNLSGLGIFINEDLILMDQIKLWKEF
jgi:hypothetical protein